MIYSAGDFVASGTKSAVLRTPDSGLRLFYAQESPEVWFEDFGEGRLDRGRAHIDPDPLYLESVTIDDRHPMKVFVQLTSGDPVAVLVEKGTTGFDVCVEDRQSRATFDYRVVAKRKGYEEERLSETRTGREDPNLFPELRAEQEQRFRETR